jgi:hypothetical protein
MKEKLMSTQEMLFLVSRGENKWRKWSIKTNAFSSTRGCQKAISHDYEHHDVDVASLTKEQTSKKVLDLKAWNNLVMMCLLRLMIYCADH